MSIRRGLFAQGAGLFIDISFSGASAFLRQPHEDSD